MIRPASSSQCRPAPSAFLLDSDVAWAGTKPGVKPAAGVPGLPFSKCFEFTQPDLSQTPRFGCFAKADRYEFEAWSEQEPDVHQQAASQYLMLTQ